MMKPFAIVMRSLMLFFIIVTPAFAQQSSCARDINGKTVCGAPDSTCLPSIEGKIVCSPSGGGIEFDMKGHAACGAGYCIRDMDGNIFCSNTPRGGAAIDQNGKAVCTGACVRGKPALCATPAPATN